MEATEKTFPDRLLENSVHSVSPWRCLPALAQLAMEASAEIGHFLLQRIGEPLALVAGQGRKRQDADLLQRLAHAGLDLRPDRMKIVDPVPHEQLAGVEVLEDA